MFGVFRVKNHDFTPKKILFFPILGGGARVGARPPAFSIIASKTFLSGCDVN
jgi:hypothetical protein